jgi:thiol-disulfide isomerase/thioredoxin/Flp pilus assembly protein TadD
MKNSMLLRTLTLITGVALAVAACTADAKLTVGDPAPKLQVAKWVQGDQVKEFDTNHVYIVEFWATWCGPCRASIPHLNELWQKFKDKGLIAIGQDVWEQDESAVAPFVKKMGDQMTYRVALDDKSQEKDGAMAVNWMKAADQHGIPTAFVVNKQGRIAWIGHPMALDEQTLADILAGRFDVAKFAKEYEKEQQEQKQRDALYTKLRQAMREKNWDAADAAVTELEKPLPESARYQFGMVRCEILFGRKDYTAAYKLANSLSDAHPDNAGLQNALAWTIATQAGLEKRDLALAEKMAVRANEATQGKEPAILDTLARVQFMNGRKKEAIETEQKAVDAAPDEAKIFYKKFLTDYQQGELPEIKE